MLLLPPSPPRPTSGLAFDSMMRVLLAENHYHKVLFRISPDGLLAHYPTTRMPLFVDGRFKTPFGSPSAVAIDAADNVYVVNGSHMVCKISRDGVATSIIKNEQWPGTAARDARPGNPRLASVVVDARGTLYLADEAGHKIYVLASDGSLDVLIDFKSADLIAAMSKDQAFAADEPFVPSGMAVAGVGSLFVASRAIVRDKRLRIRILKFAGCELRGQTSIDDSAHEIPDVNPPREPEPSNWPRHVVPHPLLAAFTFPVALAIDSRENLFVANYVKNRIHRIDRTGTSEKFAGSGHFELEDGMGASASFRQPRGLAVDAHDTLYVQDPDPHVLRRVSPAGEVTTLRARDAKASFHQPMGVAVDSAGAVYVADTFNGRICKVMPSGATITLARTGARVENEPAGTLADFQAPCALAVDLHGNVYACGKQLYRIKPDGRVEAVAGRIFNPPLNAPPESRDGSAETATFAGVRGIDVDAKGSIYIAESGAAGKIRVVTKAGEVRTLARLEQHLLMGLTLAEHGLIYVSSHRGAVLSVGLDGNSEPVLEREFAPQNVFGLAADAAGAVYVALTHPHKIVVRRPDGSWHDLAGSGATGCEDGPSGTASFAGPTDVAVDGSGIVYVADCTNNLVRRIDEQGTVSTLAGSGIKGDSDSPPGALADAQWRAGW